MKKVKVALVYDRVNTVYGGAERVLLALHKIYPQAVLYTSVYDPKKAKWAQDFTVKTSFLQKMPFASQLHRYLASFMPLAFESLDLSSYDVIISVTSAEAKGIVTRRDQLHLCYLLSPARYLYHYQKQYLQNNQLLKLPLVHYLAKRALNYLKKWDQIAIYKPDLVIPIAKIVQKRAKKYYPNLSIEKVIYPPVDATLLTYLNNKTPSPSPDQYYLLVGRLVSYKNILPAILACQKLGRQLIIVGEGPEEHKLKKAAKASTTFQKRVSQAELAALYQNCRAVLSPGLDDFGITALEANLFGKAIIVNQQAGAAELIKDGQDGLHLPYQETDGVKEITDNLLVCIQKLEQSHFDPKILSKNALKYDTNRFVLNFDRALKAAYQAKLKGTL